MNKNYSSIHIYTDGSCDPFTKNGSWAFIARLDNSNKEIVCSGFEKSTTNNRMELMAFIKSLEKLQNNCCIYLYSDSTYLLNGIKVWLPKWKKNNWKKTSNKDVKNKDLWQYLNKLSKNHKFILNWIKSHNNHEENEIVDRLALQERINHD